MAQMFALASQKLGWGGPGGAPAPSRGMSILPTVKCSDCGDDINVMAMGDHICRVQRQGAGSQYPRNGYGNSYGNPYGPPGGGFSQDNFSSNRSNYSTSRNEYPITRNDNYSALPLKDYSRNEDFAPRNGFSPRNDFASRNASPPRNNFPPRNDNGQNDLPRNNLSNPYSSRDEYPRNDYAPRNDRNPYGGNSYGGGNGVARTDRFSQRNESPRQQPPLEMPRAPRDRADSGSFFRGDNATSRPDVAPDEAAARAKPGRAGLPSDRADSGQFFRLEYHDNLKPVPAGDGKNAPKPSQQERLAPLPAVSEPQRPAQANARDAPYTKAPEKKRSGSPLARVNSASFFNPTVLSEDVKAGGTIKPRSPPPPINPSAANAPYAQSDVLVSRDRPRSRSISSPARMDFNDRSNPYEMPVSDQRPPNNYGRSPRGGGFPQRTATTGGMQENPFGNARPPMRSNTTNDVRNPYSIRGPGARSPPLDMPPIPAFNNPRSRTPSPPMSSDGSSFGSSGRTGRTTPMTEASNDGPDKIIPRRNNYDDNPYGPRQENNGWAPPPKPYGRDLSRDRNNNNNKPFPPSNDFNTPANGQKQRHTCRSCQYPIVGRSIRCADGRLSGRFHKACFTCSTCSAPFPDSQFYVLNDKPYCEYHYHKLNHSLCETCDRGIEGEYLATEEGGKYHRPCLCCTTCGQELGDEYYDVRGQTYCERHAVNEVRRLAGGNGGNGFGGFRAEKRRTRIGRM